MDKLFQLIFSCFVLFNIKVSYVDAILCYSCAESTAGRFCQTDLEKMIEQAKCVLTPNNTITDCQPEKQYFTNCSSNNPYCLIEKIESRGELDAFIRTCSNGTSFYLKDLDGLSVKPDNQTQFSYKETGYLVSITLCDTDFCNGPQFDINGSDLLTPSFINVFMLTLFAMIISRKQTIYL